MVRAPPKCDHCGNYNWVPYRPAAAACRIPGEDITMWRWVALG